MKNQPVDVPPRQPSSFAKNEVCVNYFSLLINIVCPRCPFGNSALGCKYCMPYSTKRGFRGTIRKHSAARRAYGTIARGFPRMAMRRMTGPPAALYPRIPTNATALKAVDALSAGAVQSTTAPAVLVVPKLGSAFFNRLGNRTRAISLQLTGLITATGTNAAAFLQDYMRILIYYDRQANGANPAQADILTDTTNAGAASAVIPFSALNINNRDRFVVLRDRKVPTPPIGVNGGSVDTDVISTLSTSDKNGFAYQEFIKLKGLESVYNSTNGGTIGDISAGAFGILVFNSDASGSPAWNFKLQARLKFLD